MDVTGMPRVLTWHVHGSYLYYLAQTPCLFIVPVKEERPVGYGGRSGHFPWPDNVIEVPADQVRDTQLDVILFQSRRNYLFDQHEVLSDAQRRLPRVYLEHDPPLEHPTDTRHVVDDRDVRLVHVTSFNDLMWDAGQTPTSVIEHGVMVPDDVRATYAQTAGITVANHLHERGRRLGGDLFDRARAQVPLVLAGMGSRERGGLGDLPHDVLLRREAEHRFFFNPIRYTSLGLSILEAMMVGLPIVGFATTELATVIETGQQGFLDTDLRRLLPHMQRLARSPDEAARLGEASRARALERFHIERFCADWLAFLQDAASQRATPAAAHAR